MRFRLSILLALAIPSLASAQTVTVTAPNTVNPSGQPKAVASTFIVNADGSIATIGGTTGTVATPSDRVATTQGTAANGATPAGNPNLIAGSDGSSVRTIRTDTQGRVFVQYSDAAGAIPIVVAGADTLSTISNVLPVRNHNLIFNGATWDRARGDVNGAYVIGKGGANMATGQISVSTTATLIAAARTGRQNIQIIVGAANACAVGNAGVTLTTGYLLPAVAGTTDTSITAGALYAVCSAATTISYKELF